MRINKRRGISEMLAIIILLALTVIAGAFVYTVFFGRANTLTSSAAITIQNAEISGQVLTISVQNTGTQAIRWVTLQLSAPSSAPVSFPTMFPVDVFSPNAPTSTAIAQLSGNGYVYAGIGNYYGGNNPLSVSIWANITQSNNGPLFGVTSSNWDMPFISEYGMTVYGWLWGMNSLPYTIPTPGWYMLTMTYTPGQETFYVDGVQVASASGSYSPSTEYDYWTTYISGAKPGGVNDYLTGEFANAQIYDVELSSSQVFTLFSEGITGAPLTSNTGWWPMNGTANDYSGGGNNGVVSNLGYTTLNAPNFSPGVTTSVVGIPISGGFVAGDSYVIIITATSVSGSTVTASTTVTAQ